MFYAIFAIGNQPWVSVFMNNIGILKGPVPLRFLFLFPYVWTLDISFTFAMQYD